MRNFIISLISILLVLCLWAGFSIYSSNMSESLQSQCQQLITASINKGDWASAEKDYNKLSEMWHDYRKTASVFLDSKDINEIDSTMDKAHLYMLAEDISNSSGEFSYLKDKFRFLHQNDTVTITNIF